MQQMSLKTFVKEFDMPRETVLELIRSTKGFPGYKIGGRWYIDVDAFYEWREKNNNWHPKYVFDRKIAKSKMEEIERRRKMCSA